MKTITGTGDINMNNMYEAQILALVALDDDEEELEAPFGYDNYGYPYTEEDVRSAYEDSLYHASREEN
jgi:hypothetical protein